jgi:hypothetical protein
LSGNQAFEVAGGFEFLKNKTREVGSASQGYINEVVNV